ncbi:hypothetical protein Syun_030220 [Stephania yunnanensis]|uniref:Rhamnogalacturonase A/B/Epimerase-like pectate lyase domain-containing protein n=1 Tax=Stephania yunnanensis TaxID=152371 RepID=A0AAP0HKL4_9MAGN
MSTMVLMINLTSSSVAFAAPTTFNVVDLGAKGDGRTDSTRAFLRAWESACASPSSTTIYVPQGRYLLNEVLFTGECKGRVTFKIDGTLVAPSDYHILGTSGKWITFNKVQGVSISGGILDGQGAGLWACKVQERTVLLEPGIGSLGKAANEQGVQNVTVKTATFSGSQNGVRIKTWARPKYLDMLKVNIRGSSGSQVAMKFDCSPKTPCSGIVLDNVDLTYGSKSASTSCINADGSAFGLVHPSSCLAA